MAAGTSVLGRYGVTNGSCVVEWHAVGASLTRLPWVIGNALFGCHELVSSSLLRGHDVWPRKRRYWAERSQKTMVMAAACASFLSRLFLSLSLLMHHVIKCLL